MKNKILGKESVFSLCSALMGIFFKVACMETNAFLMWAKEDDASPRPWTAGPAKAPPLCVKHSCSMGLGKARVEQATWKHRRKSRGAGGGNNQKKKMYAGSALKYIIFMLDCLHFMKLALEAVTDIIYTSKLRFGESFKFTNTASAGKEICTQSFWCQV